MLSKRPQWSTSSLVSSSDISSVHASLTVLLRRRCPIHDHRERKRPGNGRRRRRTESTTMWSMWMLCYVLLRDHHLPLYHCAFRIGVVVPATYSPSPDSSSRVVRQYFANRKSKLRKKSPKGRRRKRPPSRRSSRSRSNIMVRLSLFWSLPPRTDLESQTRFIHDSPLVIRCLGMPQSLSLSLRGVPNIVSVLGFLSVSYPSIAVSHRLLYDRMSQAYNENPSNLITDNAACTDLRSTTRFAFG